MKIENRIDRLFQKYGQEVRVNLRHVRYNIKAFVQHMRYKNKMYIDLPLGAVGERDNGCYLYVGPPECDFSDEWGGVELFVGGYRYLVKRAQMIYLGEKPIYVWAVLYRTIKEGNYERSE